MKKCFDKLLPGDKVYIINENGYLVKELTFKFHGRNSINFEEDNSCIFNRLTFIGKTEMEIKINGMDYKLKTALWERNSNIRNNISLWFY